MPEPSDGKACQHGAYTTRTAINVKKLNTAKCRLYASEAGEDFKKYLDEIEIILSEEMDNVNAAIPVAERDSRLDRESGMLYITDKEHLEWKKRQLKYALETELLNYRLSLANEYK